MIARSLGLLATTAVTATAILLPPAISSATLNTENELAALGVVDPENQLVNVPSGKCIDRDGDCSLVLAFSTAGQSKTLLINGVPFFTSNPAVTANAMNTPVMITQLESKETVVDYVANPESFSQQQLRLTGSSFETGPVEFRADSGEEVIPMNFQIYALNGQAVNVPRITLKVLKSPEAELMVLSVDIGAVQPMKNPEDKMCADWPMVCEWRDFFMGKVDAAKQGIRKLCPGMAGMADKMPPYGPPPHGPPHGPPPHRLKHPFKHHGPPPPGKGDHRHPPPHRRPHGGHRHHGELSAANVMLMLAGALLMVVVTWITGYVIGTVIGYAIVGLWMLYRRARGTPRYQRVALDDEQVAFDEEDKHVDEQEIPSEDPPAYEEKEVVV